MITIKTEKEMKVMAEGAKILASVMKELIKETKAGITTKELDRLAESLIFEYKAEPSFKGHEGFPATLCASINEEIVHVVPSNRVLKDGDIISLDLGVFYKGFHSDMAVTLAIGQIGHEAKRLIWATKKALKRGIVNAKAGNTFGDISNSIERHCKAQGFSVVKDLCGHGIGRELHEDPQILNCGKRDSGPVIKEGMCFCLEPMLTMGSFEIERKEDGFGIKTKDNSLSAHFEHTLAMTKTGCKILTALD